MGNQLFLHAHLMAYGLEHKVRFLNLAFKEYNHFFTGTEEHKTPASPAISRFFELICNWKYFNSAILRLSLFLNHLHFIPVEYNSISEFKKVDLNEMGRIVGANSVAVLNGWIFHSGSLLLKHKSEIRSFFQPTLLYEKLICEKINELKSNPAIYIGCHIRQGDYKNFMNGEFYFSQEKYMAVCFRLTKLFPDQHLRFLFCSDENIKPELLESFDSVIGSNLSIVDMYSLAQCDYIVGPPSTFSSWASYYGSVPRYQIKEPEKLFTLEDFEIYGSNL